MKPWHTLNCEIKESFRPDWKFPENRTTNHNIFDKGIKGIFHFKANSIFNQAWLSYLENIELGKAVNCVAFYKPPHYNIDNAHIDRNTTNLTTVAIYGVNLIFDDDRSDMVWYNLPAEKPIKPFTDNLFTPYEMWTASSLEEVSRTVLPNNKMTLVRTDIPHAIFTGNSGRWCISIRFKDRPELDSWEAVEKAFEHLIEDK